jgi:S1-C subfamily serine protease
MSALIAALRRHLPGDQIELAVHRDGRSHSIRVTLAPMP